jgi:hypothetical protein
VLLEPVAVAFEADHVGVVDDAVDHRGRDGGVAEHVAPSGEGQVARQDQRGMFVSAQDELEKQVRRLMANCLQILRCSPHRAGLD